MSEYDVVIIGGGAAGLSAALVLTRARRHVAVVDAGAPRNAPAVRMHGFLGSDSLPPSELLAAGRKEVSGYGGHLGLAGSTRRSTTPEFRDPTSAVVDGGRSAGCRSGTRRALSWWD
jgi:flavin-dependent dehydrogenase